MTTSAIGIRSPATTLEPRFDVPPTFTPATGSAARRDRVNPPLQWRTGLTATEAAVRGARIGRTSYRVLVDLSQLLSGPRFTVATTIEFDMREPGTEVWLDLIADSVQAIHHNDSTLTDDVRGPERLLLTNTARHNTVTVESTHLAGDIAAGMSRRVDPTDGEVYAWTQFQPFDARRMLPCFDQPDLRASFDVEVITPKHWTCVSNSRPTQPPQPEGPGRLRWKFHPTPPIPVYLLAVCAGPFAIRESTHQQIPLGLYARRSLEQALDQAAPELFAITTHGLDRFAEAFGHPYPGDSYDQVFLPDQPGAMENLGCITWNDAALHRTAPTAEQRTRRARVLLHELSHQWFGDLVSPRWWDDLWLSESFADWAAAFAVRTYPGLVTQHSDGAGVDKAMAVRADQLPSTHPVSRPVNDIAAVQANFDAITYQKGACLLHQLVDLVGEPTFLRGLCSYFRRFAWSSATIDGLLDEMGHAASGVDVRRWASEWLRTAGVNTVTAETDTAGTSYGQLTLRQTSAPAFPLLRRHHIDMRVYHLLDGALVEGDAASVDISGAAMQVEHLIDRPPGDLLLLDHHDRGFFKARLDPDSQAVLLQYGHTLPGPGPRAALRQIVDDMLFSVELGADAAVGTLTRCLGTETEVGALAATATLAVDAALLFSHPGRRSELAATVAAQCLELLENPRTPSEQRQVLWSALVRTASRPNQLAAIEDALTTDAIPLPARWPAVTRLIASGTTPDMAEQEHQRNTDPDGWMARDAAKAANNTPAAKAEALELLLAPDRLPVSRIGQLAAGIWQPFQDAELRDTAEEFLARLPSAVALTGTARAIRLADSGFPTSGLTEQIVIRTAQLATDTALPVAVRTILADQADIADRKLRTAALRI